MLAILGIALIVLILVFCGNRGSKSIVTTAVNAAVLLISVFAIYQGAYPLLVTFLACLAVAALVLFYQNDVDTKSKAAFLSVVIVMAIMLPLVFFMAHGMNAEGFNPEQYEITDSNGYGRNIQMDMLSLQISVMFIALIGAVIDIAIAITSSIEQLKKADPGISTAALTRSAFNVSRSVLNTSLHTIFYIYLAEYLTLFIQYVDHFSLSQLLNSQSFCSEIVSVSMSGIGCCLIVPVAALIGVRSFKSLDRAGSV